LGRRYRTHSCYKFPVGGKYVRALADAHMTSVGAVDSEELARALDGSRDLAPTTEWGDSSKSRFLVPDPAGLFSALGHPTRLTIVVHLLERGPLTGAMLTAGSGVTRQAIYKHLNVLHSTGLVLGLRRGKERYFTLESSRLSAAVTYLSRMSKRLAQQRRN
jgi:DNA-binding transcriptional ArsR family regulator